MRLWHFSSSVNSFFKRPCAAIQWIGLRLIPYFIYTNGEGSGETARMPRLAWAVTGRLYDKYHNLMSGLIFSLARHIVFQDESLTLCLVIMFFHGIFFSYLCSSLIKPLKLFFICFFSVSFSFSALYTDIYTNFQLALCVQTESLTVKWPTAMISALVLSLHGPKQTVWGHVVYVVSNRHSQLELYNRIHELCPNFKKIRDDDKFNYLLNSDGPNVKVVARLIYIASLTHFRVNIS